MNAKVEEILRNLPSRLKSPWVYPDSSNPEKHVATHSHIRKTFESAVTAAKLHGLHRHDLRHS